MSAVETDQQLDEVIAPLKRIAALLEASPGASAPLHQQLGLKCLCGSPSCPNPALENDP